MPRYLIPFEAFYEYCLDAFKAFYKYCIDASPWGTWCYLQSWTVYANIDTTIVRLQYWDPTINTLIWQPTLFVAQDAWGFLSQRFTFIIELTWEDPNRNIWRWTTWKKPSGKLISAFSAGRLPYYIDQLQLHQEEKEKEGEGGGEQQAGGGAHRHCAEFQQAAFSGPKMPTADEQLRVWRKEPLMTTIDVSGKRLFLLLFLLSLLLSSSSLPPLLLLLLFFSSSP
jgi:hypothetical protein